MNFVCWWLLGLLVSSSVEGGYTGLQFSTMKLGLLSMINHVTMRDNWLIMGPMGNYGLIYPNQFGLFPNIYGAVFENGL